MVWRKNMYLEYSLKNGIFADIQLRTFFIIALLVTSLLLVGLFFGILPETKAGILTGRIRRIENDDKIILIGVFGLVIIGSIIKCLFRIRTLKHFFQNGIETDAEISDSIYGDMSSFVYIYKINNIEHRLIKEVTDLEISLNYKKGDTVKVLVDPWDHEESVLKDYFLNRNNL